MVGSEEDKERIGKRFLEAFQSMAKPIKAGTGSDGDSFKRKPHPPKAAMTRNRTTSLRKYSRGWVEWFAQDPSSPRLSQIVEHLSAEEEGTLPLSFVPR